MKSPIIILPYRNALKKTLEELWVLNLGTFRFQSSPREDPDQLLNNLDEIVKKFYSKKYNEFYLYIDDLDFAYFPSLEIFHNNYRNYYHQASLNNNENNINK